MSPPNGGIPPFPGLENFMGGPPAQFPGSYPAGPGNPFYGMNPNQFNPGFRFPRGAGPRGPMQFGFPGPRGPFMPPMMQRPMIMPRGAMGRGMGRGAGRGQRGGRGRGNGTYYSGKDSGGEQSSSEKGGDDDAVNDVDDFDRGQAEGGESDDNNLISNNKLSPDEEVTCGGDSPSKNCISEQVF